MPAGDRSRLRSALFRGAAVLAVATVAGACGSSSDTQPTVASVEFEPRLVVSVDDDGMSATPGSRDGAQPAERGDTAGDAGDGWTTPAGSVVEVRNDAPDPQRVVITRTPVGDDGADPSVWLDTGDIEPGESVVLGLGTAGRYELTLSTGGAPGPSELSLLVLPRPST